MICKLLQELWVFFRLFFYFRAVSTKGSFGFLPDIIPYLKRLEKYITLIYVNLMIIKKLWISRHAFCYINDDRDFYINLYFAYGRG